MQVAPSVLQWARTRSGIAESEWAKRFPRYEGWLAGDTPTLKQVEDFAHKTHTPFGYFFLDEAPTEIVPIPDFRTVGDRAIGASLSADLLDVIYASQARQEWYRDNQLLIGEAPLGFVGSLDVSSPVEGAAAALRDALDWTQERRARFHSWDEALTGLREQSEAIGVLVSISGIAGSDTRRKLDPSEFRGFALADPYASLVFINGSDAKAAQIFTLAHELVHVWLGESALSDLDAASIQVNSVERFCNEVAAELLVPMSEFAEVFDSSVEPTAQLQSLAEQFRVSTQVILGRVREAGVISWDEYKAAVAVERSRIMELRAAGGAGGGGNDYNTKPIQIGKRLARAVVASALEGRTPYPGAFRILGVKKAATFDQLAAKLGVV